MGNFNHRRALLLWALIVAIFAGCQPCKDAAECIAVANKSIESKDHKNAFAAAMYGCDLGSEESCMLLTMVSSGLPEETRDSCRRGNARACSLIKAVFREDPQQDVALQLCTSGNYDKALLICEQIPENTKAEIQEYNRNYRRKCFTALSSCFLEHEKFEIAEKATRNVDLGFVRAEQLVAIGLKEIQSGSSENGRALILNAIKELSAIPEELDYLGRLSTKLIKAGEPELAAISYSLARDNLKSAKYPSTARWNLMVSMLDQKNYDEAVYLVSGTDDTGLLTEGKSHIAKALFVGGDKERSIKLFEDAIEETKSLPGLPKSDAKKNTIDNLSYDMWQVGLFDLAKQVVALDPTNSQQRLQRLEALGKNK